MHDELVSEVISSYFPRVIRTFSQALSCGLVDRDTLLSDYQLGITLSLPKMKPGGSQIQYLHYRGMCEVQRHWRLRSQKNLLSECDAGHSYAYNKSRQICPKCNLPFTSRTQKFSTLEDRQNVTAPFDHFFKEDVQRVLNSLGLPPGQQRVFKILISSEIFMQEDHIVNDTAKLVGLSVQRVSKVIKDNRERVKDALVREGLLER